jgi:uroporphyrinogen-III synthase
MNPRPRPLEGLRVLVTRPRAQSRPLCERLRALGAEPVSVPTISIVPPRPGGPLDRALRRLEDYDWVILTSANGARACLARARALRLDLRRARVRWAAIGPATAGVLREAGIAVAMTPSRFVTDAIAEEWPGRAGERVLLPRTDAAPPGLAEALRARGAIVEEITAYRTTLAPVGSRATVRRLVTAHDVDAVIFTSASTVHGLVRLLGDDRAALDGIEIACIGPVTAAAVTEEGFSPAVVAQEHTVEGLLDALVARHRARAARRRAADTKGDRHAQDRARR